MIERIIPEVIDALTYWPLLVRKYLKGLNNILIRISLIKLLNENTIKRMGNTCYQLEKCSGTRNVRSPPIIQMLGMKMKIKLIITLSLFLSATVFSTVASAYGDSFSCSYGKKAACLDYGDKVCSSFSKCVSSDAQCFDSYTCNYKGFICKSKFDDIADEYDNLVEEYNDLLRKYKNKISEYENLQACISYASTLSEAQDCY